MASATQNEKFLKVYWPLLAPYVVPPIAASVAIVFAYRDLVAKSAQQRGEIVKKMTPREWLKGGLKIAPTTGVIVGAQMFFQALLENAMAGESNKDSLSLKFASSTVVGMASSPFLVIFNGQTMGWSVRKSLRQLSAKQCFAISVQETAFVGGLSVVDQLAAEMKLRFGDNKAVEYFAAFLAGASGSLAGHPANTALTRWQNGMKIESVGQSMWGAFRKARAIGIFAVGYKFGKELLNSAIESPQ